MVMHVGRDPSPIAPFLNQPSYAAFLMVHEACHPRSRFANMAIFQRNALQNLSYLTIKNPSLPDDRDTRRWDGPSSLRSDTANDYYCLSGRWRLAIASWPVSIMSVEQQLQNPRS